MADDNTTGLIAGGVLAGILGAGLLADLAKNIRDRYYKVDRNRGTPKTFLWFVEEVGELATALNGDDKANLEELRAELCFPRLFAE